MGSGKVRAPSGLSPATRRWFHEVVARWELESHHTKLLVVAARAWDESEAAAALVRRDGLVLTMPSGAKRPHPAIHIANTCRATFRQAVRELDLDTEPMAETKRPPALASIAGGRR